MFFNVVNSEDKGKSVSLLFSDGSAPLSVSESHMNYQEIMDLLLSGDYTEDKIKSLANIAINVGERFRVLSDRVSIHNDNVFFDNDVVDNSIAQHILRLINDKNDDGWLALVNFLAKLKRNPSVASQNSLYTWLVDREFTILPDGRFLAYKGVKLGETGESLSINAGPGFVNNEAVNGHIPNPVGATISISREYVDADVNVGCSRGLHAGTWNYAKGFARGRILKVAIDPQDVVSVPADCAFQKLRVSRYVVLESTDVEYHAPTYLEDGDYDEDGYDEYGYDEDGYDAEGYDSGGYDADGYDYDGYDEDGYDSEGYNYDGYDEDGFDRDGYDAEGFDANGLDSDGYDENGVHVDEYPLSDQTVVIDLSRVASDAHTLIERAQQAKAAADHYSAIAESWKWNAPESDPEEEDYSQGTDEEGVFLDDETEESDSDSRSENTFVRETSGDEEDYSRGTDEEGFFPEDEPERVTVSDLFGSIKNLTESVLSNVLPTKDSDVQASSQVAPEPAPAPRKPEPRKPEPVVEPAPAPRSFADELPAPITEAVHRAEDYVQDTVRPFVDETRKKLKKKAINYVANQVLKQNNKD